MSNEINKQHRSDDAGIRFIRAQRHWLDLDLVDVWKYRDLVYLFVRRDFVATYKQTILGPLWFVIAPLFTTIVFTVVFSNIAKIPTDGLPPFLFYLSGTICWGYFSGCLAQTSNTFVANAGIFDKVYFPRLVVPISVVLSHMLKFGLQLVLFLAVFFFYMFRGADLAPNIGVLAVPLLALEMAVLGLGCGILVSSLTTKYRDMTVLVNFGVQLWMYATPIVYPLSEVPEKYAPFLLFNPMVAVVEVFRLAFLGTSALSAYHVIISVSVTLAILFMGLVMFGRVERTFMDTV